MKMHKFTIGLYDKDAKIQLIDTQTAIKRITTIFCAIYNLPGITLMNCYGAFTHADGTQIFEPSIRVETAIDELPAQEIANLLKSREAFNQEAIMYENPDGDVSFL